MKLFPRSVLAFWLAAIIPTTAPSLFAGTPQHQAKVSLSDARAKALSRVPGAVRSEELEQERGRWIYSFEIKPATGTLAKRVSASYCARSA